MKKPKEKKILYYSDELNDEFSGISKETAEIGSDFKFLHKNIFWRMTAFLVYRVIMTPFAFAFCKLKYHIKIENKGVFKKCKKEGCFLFANHTLTAGDAFIPTLESFPKRNYAIVNPDNISTPGTKNYIMMCGAIPIPQSMAAHRGFLNAIEKRVLQGGCVTVYPEAHIWPYYTGIRPFPATSFRLPVKYNVPIFVSTTTFGKPKHGKTPTVTVYVDGPFYPEGENPRSSAKLLRDRAYSTMCARAKENSYKAIEYIRKEETK